MPSLRFLYPKLNLQVSSPPALTFGGQKGLSAQFLPLGLFHYEATEASQ
jgi:hypothetical protein